MKRRNWNSPVFISLNSYAVVVMVLMEFIIDSQNGYTRRFCSNSYMKARSTLTAICPAAPSSGGMLINQLLSKQSAVALQPETAAIMTAVAQY